MNTSQGAGPPKGKTGSELFAKLAERPRPYEIVPFPAKRGTEPIGSVRLQILTESEMHRARADAERTAKAMLNGQTRVGDLGYEEIYRNELVIEMMVLAARDAEMPELPIFPTAKHAREYVTTDEFGVLAVAYNALRREAGPIISEMTEEELEAWDRALTEGVKVGPLAFSQLSSEAKTDLILHLAARLKDLRTGNGSAGSQPGESSLMSNVEQPKPESALVSDAERPPAD